ncbi:MAG: cytochrome b N-terminal domain-containing protein, partial [Solirubrobacteraceae bacterium]
VRTCARLRAPNRIPQPPNKACSDHQPPTSQPVPVTYDHPRSLGFFFFALLHMFRVWATGSFRGRRIFNWWIGLSIFMLAMGENLFGILARGDWESQFVALHSDNMLFIQPFFFNLFSPGNFSADLTIHVALMPIVIAGLILGHIVLVRINGMNRPLPSTQEPS